MDQMLLVEFIFTVVNVILVIVGLLLSWKLGRSVYKSRFAPPGSTWPAVIWNVRWKVVGLILFFVLGLQFFWRFETAYRPKTEIRSTAVANHQTQKPVEFVTPAKAPTPTERLEQNRRENEAAKEEFVELPASSKPEPEKDPPSKP
ncbi:MAG: hypothetical protein AAB455_01965 [Patescibacteria group bacterium]